MLSLSRDALDLKLVREVAVKRNRLDELYPKIRRLIPLHLLPQVVCRRLCEELTIERAAVGDILFQRGSQDADWIYLLKGEVGLEADGIIMERIKDSSDAARFPLAHQVPRKVAARALTELQYIRIDYRRLMPMEHPQNELPQSGQSIEESPGDWMTKLFKSPVFQYLPATNLHKIVQRLKAIEVRQGDKIITQGETGDCLYILRSGRCQVTRRPRPNAREVKLAQFKPGDLFGEDALLSGQPRAMDVTMLTDGVVLRLDKEDFLSLVVEPVLQKLSFESAAREVEQGAVWLDVRDPESFRRKRLKGSLNIPFFSLRMQLGGLQRQLKYILVCDQGRQSQAAAFLLLRFGFKAAVLAGGLANVPAEYLVGEDTQLEMELPEREILYKELDDDESIVQIPSQDQNQRIGEGADDPSQSIRYLDAEIEDLQAENEALRLKLEAAQAAQEVSEALQQELARLRQEKQALEEKVAAQCLRIEELEEVIRQYYEAARAEGAGQTIEALQTELDMIREQADRDVSAMRQVVEEARQECERLQRMLVSGQSKSIAALPKDLVAVDPEQLPLCAPEVGVAPIPSKGRIAPALWLLVGILLSLVSLGVGLQTESGRHWLLVWLGEDRVSGVGAPSERGPVMGDPSARSENREDGGVESEELFAQ